MVSAFSLGVHSRGHHSSWYRPDTDARIPNEFAAAAFRQLISTYRTHNCSRQTLLVPNYTRFGHSTIPGHFSRARGGGGGNLSNVEQDLISLRTTFFNPSFVQEQRSEEQCTYLVLLISND